MNPLDSIHNQTILVQSSYHPTPHLETEMEIIERLLENNNTIYWLICKKDFKVCFNNPTSDKWICNVCISRVQNGVKEVFKNIKNKEKLILKEYKDYIDFEDYIAKQTLQYNFATIQDLKKYTYQGYDLGMATASSLVSYTRDHEPKLESYTDFIKKGIQTGAYLFETFDKIIKDINPNLVIFFNGRFIENRPLLRVCQQNNMNYVTHERGGKLNTFLFRENSIPHSIETVSKEMEYLWEQATDEKNIIGEQFYKNRIKRVEEAWYSFTKEQKEGSLPESFKNNDGKKVITIFNSSLDEYEGLEGFGPYFYENDNIGIKQIAESLSNRDDIKLYLRIHPNLKGLKNAQNKFIEEEIKTLSTIEIIGAEDSVDTYALINQSDIIIVFGSTVGAEAAYAGKNVILLGKAAYENLNCFYIPKNHEEVIQAIVNPNFEFSKINTEAPLKYGYWNENFGIRYQIYEPINIGKGKYNGKIIKANIIVRKLKRFFQKFK
ncbi:conserved hypothetical protein [Flavobacterium sp. 9AF]|uniref:capsular polysaccharide export protein, LipB/KpsS family n=1 Tax=Flavobacterium sp. 9AF TaxID=2653142 RepID=UPI0012F1BB27|nr:hypothetical protein [Flavobacterium sp. 9AF]VXC13008.1 conserved hypothetical protein [Flavobacterium sp. 9AF]